MTQTNKPKWNEIKEKGGMIPLTLMLYLYRLGGRLICRIMMYFIILWYWLFSRHARQASLSYLTKLHHFAGSASPFPAVPTIAHSYRHLMCFGESILDKIEGWLGRIPAQSLTLHGHAHFEKHYQRGAIIIVSHFGNIDLLRAIKSEHPQKINILVYQKHASQFNQFLKKINHNADVNLVSVDELGVETALILEHKLAQGEWIIIAADRVPLNSNRVHQVPFLGAEALWPQGVWILANRLKVPVLAVFCYRQQEQFEVHIHKISDQINLPRSARQQALQQVSRQYITLLEQHCIRAPYQWFNFYDIWHI